ncbi:MAG: hypothetical protein QFB86_02480, partial [Patescibacteria group bacterium]|nr:hypothetical protein [Patescibacteria group bacterium]
IDHKKLDISSKKDYEELLDVIGDRRFDMITAKTSLYPHPKYLVLKKLRRYIKLLKPDGFFYLQDSIHLPHGEEFHPVKKLQMKPDFHGAGSYTGTLYDRSLPKNGLQQVFTFRGTRAKEMVVNPKAVVMMNGEIVPLIDAIRLRAAEFSA